MAALVIVESPGKVKKLKEILGPEFFVAASVGHVRDLPSKESPGELVAGVGPDLAVRYVATDRGKEVLAKLKAMVGKADRVFLATDPDREGEAIAWHLADALKIRDAKRVTFNAISAPLVRAAVASPRPIDMDLVRAQEARRVLDRLVGYLVSPALSRGPAGPLSAGRVQTPAVRLVVERDREIAAFKPLQHYGVELLFPGGWQAQWDVTPHLPQGQEHLLDLRLAHAVAEVADVFVDAIEESVTRVPPAPPFTTSTLQQAASSRLKMKPKQTMELAQRLYEQGVITYHRTDSPNFGDEGLAVMTDQASAEQLATADAPRKWKAKDGAQEGHEAIRPTHPEHPSAGETEDERRLYQLIRSRALAAVMADAQFAVRMASLTGFAGGQQVRFVARGSTCITAGWKALYAADEDDGAAEAEQESKNPVPSMLVGTPCEALRGRVVTKVTKAPPRYKLASLVKALEQRGIGRPSTYAAILENITSRGYIQEDAKGFLTGSPIGQAIIDALAGSFQFAELEYTRELEDQLDQVAAGKAAYRAVVDDARQQLSRELQVLSSAPRPAGPAAAGPSCPDCGSTLRRLKGAKGFFWGCTGYPDCKATLPDEKGKPGQRKERTGAAPPPAEKCWCGKDLRRQTKAAKGKERGFDFFGCTGYPSCKLTYKVSPAGLPIVPPRRPDNE